MSTGDPYLDALDAAVNLPGRIGAALPGAVITSGLRSPAEQQALIDRGATTATHSPHVTGNGFDVRPIDGMSPQDALAQLQQQGVPVNQVIDETHQGTGPHWHFAGDLGGAMPAVDQRGAAAAIPPQTAAQSPDQPDPYLQALDTAIAAPHVGAGDQLRSDGGVGRAANARADDGGRGGGGSGAGVAGDSQGWGGWLASLDPLADSLVNGTNYGDNLRNTAVGTVAGIAAVPETLMNLGAWFTRKSGDAKSADTINRWSKGLNDYIRSFAADPQSNNFKSREIGGEIAATWPIAEVKGLQLAPYLRNAVRARELAQLTGEALPTSTKLAAALARYGDMSAQGAAAAGITSRGEDVGTKMGYGAALAPIVGAGIEKTLPALIAGSEKIASSKLAQGLRNAMGKGASEATAADRVVGDVPGWSAEDLAQGWRRGADGQPEFAPGPAIRKGSEIGPNESSGGWEIGPDGKPHLFVNIVGGAGEPAAAAKSALNPQTYVDQYLAGAGRGDAPADLELQQFAANNGPAIEAEFSKRASEATRTGGGEPLAPSRPAATLDDAQAAVAQFMGQPIENEATGVAATVTRNSLGKLTSRSAVAKSSSPQEHALAVANADDLFRKAQLIFRHPDTRGEPTLNISRWRSMMDTPNGPRGVKMTVRETADPNGPNPLYTLETMEVEPAGSAPRGGIEPDIGQSRPSGPAGSADDIAAPGPNSNLADALRQEAGAPPPPSEEAAALADGLRREAIGSRGSRAGLEANTNWPPEVAAHAKRLVADGMGLDQALREAEITYVGAKPALAHVTRNPADQRAMWEGAKQDTLEGQQLATQIATNNAALHSTLQRDIAGYGGVPAQGEATELAARNLARRADLGREEVSKLYNAAAQAAGDVRVKPDELFAVVGNRRHKAAVTDQGAAFIRGMNQRLMDLTRNGRLGLTAPELDQLHQYASYAFDHSGPAEVNKLIWQAKDAIDHHLDQIGEAAPAYRKARNAHRIWAEQYENPEGVRRLIARRPDGTFLLEDNWRRAEGMIAALGDRQFIQVVRQLKAIGDSATLDRLKASVLQSAYEHASGARGGNAVDMIGNSPVSGKMLLGKLDQIGMPKLRALFTAKELGRIASIGRAASHLNEAVPGTVNTSGTSSALLNALKRMKGVQERKSGFKSRAADAALLVGGQVAGHMLMPGVGGAVVGTTGNLAKGVAETAAEGAAKRELAQRLREAMDPEVARASAKAARERLTDALRRRKTARTIAATTPPITGSAQKKRGQH